MLRWLTENLKVEQQTAMNRNIVTVWTQPKTSRVNFLYLAMVYDENCLNSNINLPHIARSF